MDITKDQLYITQFIRVVESRLTRRFIPFGATHNRDTLVLVLAGECTLTLDDGRVFELVPGDLIYHAYGQDYSMDILSDDYRYLVCDLRFSDTTPRKGQLYHLKNPSAMEHQFRKLIAANSQLSADRIPRCMIYLYEIYRMLIQNQQEQYVPGSAKMRIEQARLHIHANITNPSLSVAQLAQQAEMSEVHFRKLFADLYALSPAKYILQERVSYAQSLMELNELRLEDIALQAGFSSLPHLCRVFRNVTGTTPAAYRRKLTEGKKS